MVHAELDVAIAIATVFFQMCLVGLTLLAAVRIPAVASGGWKTILAMPSVR